MSEFDQRRRQKIWACSALLPLCLVLAIGLGSSAIEWRDVGLGIFGSAANQAQVIVQQIRVPRALLALCVGALLGISGAATQGLFRNPLADPSLIGVTAGSSAGAALMILIAGNMSAYSALTGFGLISVGAFVGGSLTALLVYSIATGIRGTSVATMLLAGIAITALAGSLGSLIEFFADGEMLRRISLWRMGGLDGANFTRVGTAAAVVVLVLAVLPGFSVALNALSLGESEARHLGIAVQKTKIMIIVLVALSVAISVALAGTIAFVGLVVPHIMRLMIGPDHRFLLPMSALGGAILLLLADTVARTVLAPIELPVGLVTAILGAPFFISLLRRRQEFGFVQ